jgi:hypothetical protein
VDLGLVLDLAATLAPATGILILLRAKTSLFGIQGGSVIRISIAFISAVLFDSLSLLGYTWATYGVLASIWLMSSGIGTLAATFYFSPESRSMRESISKIRRNLSYRLYNIALFGWLVLSITLPSLAVPISIILVIDVTVYPTWLFLKARRRASVVHVRDTLALISVSWVSFVTIGIFLVGLSASIPDSSEFAFLVSSPFFLLMSKAIIDPAGLSKAWSTFLIPETIVRLGKRYLIVHDSGAKAQLFLTSSLKSLVASGAKIVINSSPQSLILNGLLQNRDVANWMSDGKLVDLSIEKPKPGGTVEGLSSRRGVHPATVYVSELDRKDILGKIQMNNVEKDSPYVSELFLVESNKASRSQIGQFIERNADVQLLDLAEHATPFSNMVNLEHASLQGSTILLEYTSASNYESAVDKFLSEATGNAEMSVLFTSKSSKLYRAIKGKSMVKIVSASSLVSAPDELLDGEIQIPDRELGLVTSIASDLMENSKNMALSFAFDSLVDLIRGDRWEQVYSGVKQLVELLRLPSVTALFLANSDSYEPHFLGALRSLFSIQLRLDTTGLQIGKLA